MQAEAHGTAAEAEAYRTATREAHQRQTQQYSTEGTKGVTVCRLVEAQRQARAERAAAEEAYQRRTQQFSPEGTKIVTECRLVSGSAQAAQSSKGSSR